MSLITPCHNSARYVGNLLDSVINQDYPDIEMIVVDDGSTDDTVAVVSPYIPMFKRRGYSLQIIRQDHSGQSAAIGKAIKLMTGRFFAWPDSDDFYSSPHSISILAGALAVSDDSVGAVRCLPIYRDTQGKELISEMHRVGNLDKEWLFDDAVTETAGFFSLSGGYMVKTTALDRCVPGRNIPTAPNAGQNWQLLLPVLYHYRCLTVKRQLITIIVRSDSHSRGAYKTFESIRQKLIDFHKVRRETILGITGMPESNRSRTIAAAETQFQQMMLSNAIRHNRDKDFRESISALSMLGVCVSKRLRILAALSHIPSGVLLAKMLLRAFRIYDKIKRH